jgi:NitT/TauT family transport system ATP-binding protein
MTERAPAVEVLSAQKTFPDGTRAVSSVDLLLDEGEFVTLIGPSGCGKSTLLRMIAGLTAPSAGSVRRWGAERLADSRDVGFVFQSPTLMPWARVRPNVRLPLELAGVPRPDAEARVDEALALVGLAQFGGHYPRQLSGGMQMRVSIARALVHRPRLLLMDEPFGALDEITRNPLDEDLLALWQERRFSALFVTHSIYEAVFLSTRVLVMTSRPGRIASEVMIAEPFPRSARFRTSAAFAEACSRLSGLLAEASGEAAAAAA